MAPTIVIASDHSAADGLAQIIRQARPNAIVSQAYSLRATADFLRRQRADLVLADLELADGGGFAGLLVIRKTRANTRLLAIAPEEERALARRARCFGALGLLTWSAPPLLVRAVVAKSLAGQECWLPDDYLRLARAEMTEEDRHVIDMIAGLTPAQIQVLVALGNGLLNKQIAYDLNITEATVKAHLTMIYRKLGVGSRAAAAAMGQVLLLPPPLREERAAVWMRPRATPHSTPSGRQKIEADVDRRG